MENERNTKRRSNLNNNNLTPKPRVPAKPQNLKPVVKNNPPRKSASSGFVTPRSWQPQKTKFEFPGTEGEGSTTNPSIRSAESKYSASGWRSMPKVITKEKSIDVDSGKRNQNPAQQFARPTFNNYKHSEDVSMKYHSKPLSSTNAEEPKGFNNLKQMWSVKSKNETNSSLPLAEKVETEDSLAHENGTDAAAPETTNDEPDTRERDPLSRTTSSSSNCSAHSIKRKSGTWHYLKATSPTGSLRREDSVTDSVFPQRGKRVDASLQSPRPFRGSSIDQDVPPWKQFSNNSSVKRQSNNTMQSKDETTEIPEEESIKEDSLSAEMYEALHKYRLSFPEANENADDDYVPIYPDDREARIPIDPVLQSYHRTAKLQKQQAVAIEGVTVHESHTDNTPPKRIPPTPPAQEAPPPLLPRDKFEPRQNRQTPTASQYRRSYGDTSPDAKVPPPLLPRGRTEGPLDYTPMSGADPSLRDKKSLGSSIASLSSLPSPTGLIDRTTYEPMVPYDDERKVEYSAAVDPPKRTMSIREYHEIDPDPEVGIAPLEPGSVPPPPKHEPPILPVGTRSKARSPSPPASPPPLPPLNTDKQSHKKLNYVEVEIGSSANNNKVNRKSYAKTNYSEVVVGGIHLREASEQKKGKSVKGKILSMLGYDGYASEGDVISESKKNDEQLTDFAKERNKLKRLSGRLLRKKKTKSRDLNSQNSTDSPPVNHDTAEVGIYGSTTNLSTTSSESSNISHVASTSNSNTSSGDGQAVSREKRHSHPTDLHDHTVVTSSSRHIDVTRRLSHEPTVTQVAPKLGQKSCSEQQLNSSQEISMPKSYLEPRESPMQVRSAESTPSHRYQAYRSGGTIAGSPDIQAPRVRSHLHQNQAHRPVSEPPQVLTEKLERNTFSSSTSVDLNSHPATNPPQPGMVRVLPLVLPPTRTPLETTSEEQLSPNLPTAKPPDPPSMASVPERPPKSFKVRQEAEKLEVENEAPPMPNRDLKPDRFRPSFAEDVYSPASDVPEVTVDPGQGPIYDSVPSDIIVPPSVKNISKLLESEPLYQIYRSRTLSHASMRARNSEGGQRRRVKTASAPATKYNVKNISDQIWQSELMTDDAGATTLWREIPEVVSSGVGAGLTNDQMKLQQAQFEVVTSQASYMRSLNILVNHFMRDWSMESQDILPKVKRKQLFSNIEAVREVEHRFLQDIEQHFWEKLLLTDVAKITAEYAKSKFEVYVRYVQNQVYQDRVLTDLQRNNDKFSVELTRLEQSPFCNKLPLLSFLLLPMQRVTRLPLLISAIVNQADSAGDLIAYQMAKKALAVVNKLVKKCNEGARKMQQTEQLAEIASELAFASKVKTYALVSQSRALVKKGEMQVTIVPENKKSKVMKLHLFLFTDVLLLARKKSFLEAGSNLRYEVIDWAKRAMLFVNERAVTENEIFLVLLENCNGKRVELTLNPISQNELSRWTDALNPQRAEESGDSIYESWDCPQYQCVIPYTAQQPDELTLDAYDVMRVLRKTTDGWLEGERMRDNEVGWFPMENCEEIEDEHVRARNLRNLYRILPASSLNEIQE